MMSVPVQSEHDNNETLLSDALHDHRKNHTR